MIKTNIKNNKDIIVQLLYKYLPEPDAAEELIQFFPSGSYQIEEIAYDKTGKEINYKINHLKCPVIM